MTRDEIVKQITDANTELVFCILANWMPIVRTPILAWVLKYYIAKGLRPGVMEGVVLVAFKAIDWKQESKAKAFADALERYKNAMGSGHLENRQANDDFDFAFRRAINLNS